MILNNDNENDSTYNNKNRNNNIISELKNKLALKFKKEINKKENNNLIKN